MEATTDRRRTMPSFGFISDKLDIKFLILYIMARVVEGWRS